MTEIIKIYGTYGTTGILFVFFLWQTYERVKDDKQAKTEDKKMLQSVIDRMQERVIKLENEIKEIHETQNKFKDSIIIDTHRLTSNVVEVLNKNHDLLIRLGVK